jgi:hypothetical protein
MHNSMQLSQPVPLNSKLWSNCLVCGRGDPGSILNGTVRSPVLAVVCAPA